MRMDGADYRCCRYCLCRRLFVCQSVCVSACTKTEKTNIDQKLMQLDMNLSYGKSCRNRFWWHLTLRTWELLLCFSPTRQIDKSCKSYRRRHCCRSDYFKIAFIVPLINSLLTKCTATQLRLLTLLFCFLNTVYFADVYAFEIKSTISYLLSENLVLVNMFENFIHMIEIIVTQL